MDTFAPLMVDNSDVVIANHPNSLAQAVIALETKLALDNDPIVGTGGLQFDPAGNAANPGAPNCPTLWIDNVSPAGLWYTDDTGADYDLLSGGGVPTLAYIPDMIGTWTDTGVISPFTRSYIMRLGNTLYAFGADIYSAPVADPTNWTDTTANIALGTEGMRVARIGDTLYSFGALYNSVDILTASVADPLTWSDSGHDLPRRADNAPFVLTEDRVIIYFGHNGAVGSGNAQWALYSDLSVWTDGALTPGHAACWEAGGCRLGDKIFLTGGVNFNSSIRQLPVSNGQSLSISTLGMTGATLQNSPDIFNIGTGLYVLCSAGTFTYAGFFEPQSGKMDWFNRTVGDGRDIGYATYLDDQGYAYFVQHTGVPHKIFKSPRLPVTLDDVVVPGATVSMPARFFDGTRTLYTSQCITGNKYWHYRPDLTATI
jgi:hypothetical protein